MIPVRVHVQAKSLQLLFGGKRGCIKQKGGRQFLPAIEHANKQASYNKTVVRARSIRLTFFTQQSNRV